MTPNYDQGTVRKLINETLLEISKIQLEKIMTAKERGDAGSLSLSPPPSLSLIKMVFHQIIHFITVRSPSRPSERVTLRSHPQ